MKYMHFDDIMPNNRTDFSVLYYSACRTMQKLERSIRRRNNGRLTFIQFMCLKKIYRKLSQMVALWHATRNNVSKYDDIHPMPGAKYPTGTVIDLKSPQCNDFT